MRKINKRFASAFIAGMLAVGITAGTSITGVNADEIDETSVSSQTDAVIETTDIEEIVDDTYIIGMEDYTVPEDFEESFPGVEDNSRETANGILPNTDYYGYVYIDYDSDEDRDEVDYYEIVVSEECLIEVSTDIIDEKTWYPLPGFGIDLSDSSGNSIPILDQTDGVYRFYVQTPGTYYILAKNSANYYTYYSFNYSQLELDDSDDDVAIDKYHFPDSVFCEYLKQFDIDEDNALSDEELGQVKSIDVSNKNIYTLYGLRRFYNLESLNCIGCQINEIDISKNTKLQSIELSFLRGNILDIRNNPELEYINFVYSDGSAVTGGVITQEDGEDVWYYYKGDKISTDPFNTDYGYFFLDGRGDATINGVYRFLSEGRSEVVEDPYDIYIVKDGMLDISQNDVFREVTTVDGVTAWYYFVSGHRHFGYAGSRWTCENAEGTWLIRFGAIEHVTGYYEVNGNVEGDPLENGVYYFVNGKLDTTKNGPVSGTIDGTKAWYYVVDGKVDFNHKGFEKVGSSWMYFSNGMVDKTINADHYGSFYGTIDGVGGWYVVKAGKAYPDYNGFALVGSSWMQYKNGKVDKSYTGTLNININGTKKWYYINKGKAILDYTGFGKIGSSWMYMKKGDINKKVTGIITGTVNGTKAKWYVKSGKVQFTYSGTYKKNGKTYTIKNGKVTSVK